MIQEHLGRSGVVARGRVTAWGVARGRLRSDEPAHGEDRPAGGEIALERGSSGSPQQSDPLLATLAEDAHLTPTQIEGAEVRRGELADPEPRGIRRLDDRPVAQSDR